jgi:hypothetical protein
MTENQSPQEKFSELNQLFNKLEYLKKIHFEIYGLLQGDLNDNIYHLDMFLKPVLKRSLDLTDSFSILVNKWHYSISGAILRMQLDNLLRVYYVFQRKDNDRLFIDFLREGSFRLLKHTNGQRVTDRLLIEIAKPNYPWIENVYKETSNFIHLSTKHFLATIIDMDTQKRTIEEFFGIGFFNWPEFSIIEEMSAYIQTTNSLLDLMKKWINLKNSRN